MKDVDTTVAWYASAHRQLYFDLEIDDLAGMIHAQQKATQDVDSVWQ